MQGLRRDQNLFSRMLGIILLIPGLLQVPLPEADFHVVRHHHDAGEVCPIHNHLLRWHPQAGEGEAVAVLHWHWLLPKTLDSSALDESSAKLPSLHAHDGESPNLHQSAGSLLIREHRGRDGSRIELASAIDLQLSPAPLVDALTIAPMLRASANVSSRDGLNPAAALSRLVRWNC